MEIIKDFLTFLILKAAYKMIDEMEIRQKIVEEAKSWAGTPYHLGARIKGVGCDCASFILQVMVNVGVFSNERLETYGPDWFKHTEEERYRMQVLRHAKKIVETICYRSTVALPGQIVLGRCGISKVLNHGAIVIQYPVAVHAVVPCVKIIDLSTDPLWAYHSIEIYDPLLKGEG